MSLSPLAWEPDGRRMLSTEPLIASRAAPCPCGTLFEEPFTTTAAAGSGRMQTAELLHPPDRQGALSPPRTSLDDALKPPRDGVGGFSGRIP